MIKKFINFIGEVALMACKIFIAVFFASIAFAAVIVWIWFVVLMLEKYT